MTDECEKPVNGHRHTISISINGIAYKTQENKLTTAEILALAGFTPEDYTLVRKEKPSEALPLDQPIHLKDGDEFLALRKTNTVSEIGGMKDLESFFSERLGVAVDYLKGGNGENLIIHDVEIPAGPLVGKVCDIGIQCTVSSPFNPHPAFHTRPPLVPFGTNATQAGKISVDWQYWSRQWPKPPLSAEEVWAWVLTALTKATL